MSDLKYKNIAIISAFNNQKAEEKKQSLIKKYNFVDLTNNPQKLDNIDLVIALGGDGTMLHLLHQYEKNPIPLYGINCGTIGFLTNNVEENNLLQIVNKAQIATLHPLRMTAISCDDKIHNHIAINEVSLLRQTSQTAKIKVMVNDKERFSELICDGILLATSAGSTAYNMSLRGPIIPLGSKMLALTPISPFRPRNWHGAILPTNVEVEFEILDYQNRQVSATADFIEVRNIKKVKIKEDNSISFKLLFNSDHSLEERIIREQFANYSK